MNNDSKANQNDLPKTKKKPKLLIVEVEQEKFFNFNQLNNSNNVCRQQMKTKLLYLYNSEGGSNKNDFSNFIVLVQ